MSELTEAALQHVDETDGLLYIKPILSSTVILALVKENERQEAALLAEMEAKYKLAADLVNLNNEVTALRLEWKLVEAQVADAAKVVAAAVHWRQCERASMAWFAIPKDQRPSHPTLDEEIYQLAYEEMVDSIDAYLAARERFDV